MIRKLAANFRSGGFWLVAAPALVGFACRADAAGEKHIVHVRRGQTGSHRYTLTFVQGPLRFRLHRVTHIVREGVAEVLLDGESEWNSDGSKNWYGTDGGLPSFEFYRIKVVVDGKSWPVSPRLYAKCYEVNCNPGSETNSRLSTDAKRLYVRMFASDGAGAYYVRFVFRRNGHHRCSVEYGC